MKPVYVIADDHPLFRDAMELAVRTLEPHCELHTVGDLDALRAKLQELGAADLVMLDLAMPGASGYSGLVSMRAEFPETPVIVVSASEKPSNIRKCIDLGASGFIPKSSGAVQIKEGIAAVQAGSIWMPSDVSLDEIEEDSEIQDFIQRLQSLTPQQARVLAMLGEGLLNKQIAYELDVSEATIKAHVSAVLMKLGVDSRTQAVIIMNKLNAGLPSANVEENT